MQIHFTVATRPNCSGLPDRTTLRPAVVCCLFVRYCVLFRSSRPDYIETIRLSAYGELFSDCSGLPDWTSLRRVIARFCGGCLGGLFRSFRLVYILRPERSRGGVARCFREELARTFCAASSLFFLIPGRATTPLHPPATTLEAITGLRGHLPCPCSMNQASFSLKTDATRGLLHTAVPIRGTPVVPASPPGSRRPAPTPPTAPQALLCGAVVCRGNHACIRAEPVRPAGKPASAADPSRTATCPGPHPRRPFTRRAA